MISPLTQMKQWVLSRLYWECNRQLSNSQMITNTSTFTLLRRSTQHWCQALRSCPERLIDLLTQRKVKSTKASRIDSIHASFWLSSLWETIQNMEVSLSTKKLSLSILELRRSADSSTWESRRFWNTSASSLINLTFRSSMSNHTSLPLTVSSKWMANLPRISILISCSQS